MLLYWFTLFYITNLAYKDTQYFLASWLQAINKIYLLTVMHSDGQGTASNDQLVIAEHEILDGCPETGLISMRRFLTSTTSLLH